MNERIRQLRTDKGVTQQELADALGITQQAVGRWERGLATPDSSTLPRIADYFGVTVDELLGRDTKPAPIVEKKPKDLKKILEQHEIMFDGVPIDDEAKEDILHIVEFELYKRAKAMNKRKPKENK